MISEEIVKEIASASKKEETEIMELIKRKQAFFENLISEEGAAQIVAADLGVKLEKKPISFKPMKISDIIQKMSNVNLVCKVVRIFEPRQFKTEKAEGFVGSIILGDETGSIRVVLWNEQLTQVLEQIKEGDVLRISNAYARENNRSDIELHFGTTTKIEIDENTTINNIKSFSSTPIIPIRIIKEGYVRIKATVIQKFDPTYYIADPETGKKVAEGTFNAVNRAILNLIIDDGTGSVRITLFGERAEEILKQKDLLGREFYFEGKATYNEQFDRVDVVVNKWEPVFAVASESYISPTEIVEDEDVSAPEKTLTTKDDKTEEKVYE